MLFTALKAGAAGAAVLLSVSAASAVTLTLESAPDGIGTHPQDTPCIISGTTCPGQNPPDDLDYTNYVQNGSQTSLDLFSPAYTVGEIVADFGNLFSVGFDVNDTNVAQTLSLFQMLIDGVVVATYTGSAGNVPNSNNGTGFADYLLNGFNLSGYSAGLSLQFYAELDGLNDGHEQFFLVDVADPPVIPVPAAGILMLTALGALGLVRHGRKSTS